MVVFACKSVYARYRHGQDCKTDTPQKSQTEQPKNIGICTGLITLFLVFSAVVSFAKPLRVATFNVSLGRDGPGLLYRDILKGTDPQIDAVLKIISRIEPDIILLNDFDADIRLVALRAFRDQLSRTGPDYPYLFAPMSNNGVQSGVDLDGDGFANGAGDALGFGKFPGSQGMAVLSRFPFDRSGVKDFSSLLWKDFPANSLPASAGKRWPGKAVRQFQPLSSKGHWDVPVILPSGNRLHLLASHPTPPVFDGAENRNGLRNRDEIRFWTTYLRRFKGDEKFVILGDLNADPKDGEGSHKAIMGLINHPKIQDPLPQSRGAAQASLRQGGPNLTQKSDPKFDTVDWDESRTPGNMRVDYVLPSATFTITGAGVFWPAPGEDGFELVGSDGSVGSHHRLVWVDVE